MFRRISPVAVAAITTALLLPRAAACGERVQTDIAQVVARHIAAIGGADAIRNLNDFELHLVYTEGSFSAESLLAQARPYFRLVRVPAGSLTRESVLEGYDGSSWEYYGDPGVVLRTVSNAGSVARRNAHQFIDPLVDASKNGTALAYGGERTVDGRNVTVVRARFSDGTVELIFVDPSSYMIDGFAEDIPFHAFGNTVRTHFAMGDYRAVGGVLMPFRTVQIDDVSGKPLDSSVTVSARANIGLAPAYFAPPAWKLTPLQQMISSVYEEREDADAAVETYRDYRREYGAAPASLEAVNFIGYQCLKMGSVKTAIAVLALNVTYYENSATAHFGLGRAMAAGGETESARKEFKRALEIDPSLKRAADALAALG